MEHAMSCGYMELVWNTGDTGLFSDVIKKIFTLIVRVK